MNFFEHQDLARRKTGRLVFLFVLAVAGIIVALYFASRILLLYGSSNSTAPHHYSWWDPGAFAGIAVVASLLIGLSSWSKIVSLRKGGSAVAEMLGGRQVKPGTADPLERRLLNVVEEMAIASGIPVPKVYLLEGEGGINAFAAGHSPDDAAVAVTRGTLRMLDRNELQGVVAHEFSHILNGDMKLNLNLIGILFGIFVLGIIGRILLHVGGSSRGGSKKGTPVIAIAGILLMLIGTIGTLVGRMIQSAVSRQREYLADSSAVQFTRNPSGIAGALKKIGGFVRGSRVESPKAEQVSHMFFALGLKPAFFSGLFATHPPLAERISRIDRSFNGRFVELVDGDGDGGSPGEDEPSRFDTIDRLVSGLREDRNVMAGAGEAAGRVGTVAGDDPLLGAALLRLIPGEARSAVVFREGAEAVIAALLLDRDDDERARQFAAIREVLDPSEIEPIERAREALVDLAPAARLPLVDLAAPTLRESSPEERTRFLRLVDRLIEADRKVTLFEFTLKKMLTLRLGRADSPPPSIRVRSFGPLLRGLSELFSVVAIEGNRGDETAARAAFDRAVARIPELQGTALPFHAGGVPFDRIDKVLDRLAVATFKIRERVVDGCAHAALADRKVTPGEAELLRVISASIECPMPPFPPLVASGAV